MANDNFFEALGNIVGKIPEAYKNKTLPRYDDIKHTTEASRAAHATDTVAAPIRSSFEANRNAAGTNPRVPVASYGSFGAPDISAALSKNSDEDDKRLSGTGQEGNEGNLKGLNLPDEQRAAYYYNTPGAAFSSSPLIAPTGEGGEKAKEAMEQDESVRAGARSNEVVRDLDTVNNIMGNYGYSDYYVGNDGDLYYNDANGNAIKSIYGLNDGNIDWTLSGESLVPSDAAGMYAAMYLDRNRIGNLGDNWGAYQASNDKEWWKNAMRSDMLSPYYAFLLDERGWDIGTDEGFDDYWDYSNNLRFDPANMSAEDRKLVYGNGSAGAINSTNRYYAFNPNFQYGLYGVDDTDIGDLTDEQLQEIVTNYGLSMGDDGRLYYQGNLMGSGGQGMQQFLNRATVEDFILNGYGDELTTEELEMLAGIDNDIYGYGDSGSRDDLRYDYGDLSNIDLESYNPYALNLADVAGNYMGQGSLNPNYNDIIGSNKKAKGVGYYERAR